MDSNGFLYSLKGSLITQTEKSYLTAIKRSLPSGYFVQPQINLASIITKNDDSRFQNELYRNVDACVFDLAYKPIVIIEINDSTHNSYNRRERDIKVKNICEEAGIKVITLWTKFGVNQEYITKVVNEAIREAPNFIRICHSQKNSSSAESNNNPEIGTRKTAYSNNSNQPIFKEHTDYNTDKHTKDSSLSNACYIATAVYGSYDCSDVWVLRRFRDYKLAQSVLGRIFIKTYYAISPKLLKLFGNKTWFIAFWRKRLDSLILKLKREGYSDEPYQDLY